MDLFQAAYLIPLFCKFNLLCTSALFGLILVIQIVHYPSFYWVENSHFVEFEKFHARAISKIVGPLMLLELLFAIALFFLIDGNLFFTYLNIPSLILIWLVTFFKSMPCHKALLAGKSKTVIDELIASNWSRTIIWGLRSLFLLFALN